MIEEPEGEDGAEARPKIIWIMQRSVPFSRRWVAKLWRRTWAVTRLSIHARRRVGPASRLQGAKADVIAQLLTRKDP